MAIYVWGTGCGASELEEKGMKSDKIACYLDSNPAGKTFRNRPVLLPEQVTISEEDLVIVTTRQADAVAARCRELGIPGENVLFLKNHCTLLDRNDGCPLAEKLLGKELLEALLPRQHIISTPPSLVGRDPEGDNDYVRVATLELLRRRIRELPGALAELGVYRGGFAREINRRFPERTLYLFDSFGGFVPEEAAGELERNTCTEAFLQAHRNTAADRVLQSMPCPQSVVMKIGYFPHSLEGLEERFCLVSLDADFRDTTLEGLRYFWPRLVPGGYLMLHDWGSPKLTGVREALICYEEEVGCHLPGVPLPDLGNSLILCK